MTVSSSLEKIIDNVSNAISEQALFFSEILSIYCSPELEYELHQCAQFKLNSTLRYFGNTSINLNRLPVLSRRTLQSYVLLSISVIAYKKYDGKIWEHIKDVYEKLYNDFDGSPKIDNLIQLLIGDPEIHEVLHIAPPIVYSVTPIPYQIVFFDFIDTIFQYNFDGILYNDKHIDRILTITLESLMKKLSGNDDLDFSISEGQSKLKSYRLSKFTQRAIMRFSEDTKEIIKDLLKIFDHFTNGRELEDCDKNIVTKYTSEIEEWIINHTRSESIRQERKPYKNSYQIGRDNHVFLLIKNLLFEDIDSVDYQKVKIIIEENQILKELVNGSDYTLSNAVGALKIDIKPIKLTTIFVKRKITILFEGNIIYQTDEKLNRQLLLFDEKGGELTVNEKHSGVVTVVYPREHLFEVSPIISSNDYKISQFIVEPKTYRIGALEFDFLGIQKFYIDADYTPNCVVQKGNKEYEIICLLKKIDAPEHLDNKPSYLLVNDRKVFLGATFYDLEESFFLDFNKVKVMNNDDNVIYDFGEVFFEPTINPCFSYYQNSEFSIKILSLTKWYYEGEPANEKELFFNYQETREITFNHADIASIKFKVTLDKGLIKLDNNDWMLIENVHSIRQNFTELTIYHPQCRLVKITGVKHLNSKEIVLKKLNEHVFSTNDLYDLSADEDVYIFNFYDIENRLLNSFKLFVKPTVINAVIDYEKDDVIIDLLCTNFEVGILKYELLEGGNLISESNIENHVFKIPKAALVPFMKYKLKIIRNRDVFRWGHKLLYEGNVIFEDMRRLEGRKYPIKQVCLDNGTSKYVPTELRNTDIVFNKMIEENEEGYVYTCSLYKRNQGVKFKHIDPVYVTIYHTHPQYPNLVDEGGDPPYYLRDSKILFDKDTTLKNEFAIYCICLDYTSGRRNK